MLATYVISFIMMCVFWYLLKHAYYEVKFGVWKPIEIRRWQILVSVVLFFIAGVNVFVTFVALLYITIDPNTKIKMDNWFTRSWKSIECWLNKKI